VETLDGGNIAKLDGGPIQQLKLRANTQRVYVGMENGGFFQC
jgi:hypothetical protein